MIAAIGRKWRLGSAVRGPGPETCFDVAARMLRQGVTLGKLIPHVNAAGIRYEIMKAYSALLELPAAGMGHFLTALATCRSHQPELPPYCSTVF